MNVDQRGRGPGRNHSHTRAHTLLEVLIAMTVGLLVLSAAGALYHAQRLAQRRAEDGFRMRDAAATALMLIGQQIQMLPTVTLVLMRFLQGSWKQDLFRVGFVVREALLRQRTTNPHIAMTSQKLQGVKRRRWPTIQGVVSRDKSFTLNRQGVGAPPELILDAPDLTK